MQAAVRLIEDATRGFRECGLTWKDTAMMLEFLAKDCRPNKFLEAGFYFAASVCVKLPESVKAKQVSFEWKELPDAKAGSDY